MAESNKIRFLLFVSSFMIFPAHALDVILSSADGDMKQKSEIETDIRNGEKIYVGTVNELGYQAQNGTSNVIVHISSKSRFVEIMRYAVRETRLHIARELFRRHYELVFLGIENFDDDEYHLISAFMLEKIKHHPNQTNNFKIETIGESRFDRYYKWRVVNFSRYQENDQICGGTLVSRLNSIPRGALKPNGINDKEIRLCEFRPFVREVTWPVHVEGNAYVPTVNVSDPEYNFQLYHPNRKINLVILSGREYYAAISYGPRTRKMMQIREFQKIMTKYKEVLIILGVFNFDWTEIDIVTQIIFCHTKIEPDYIYNVFICGFGMFNTIYENEHDGRRLLQVPNPRVAEIMKVLIEKEVKQRSIAVYYKGCMVAQTPINLKNGRYHPEKSFTHFYFTLLNQKIALIVYDETERNDSIDFSMVGRPVEELERSGIHVVMIEAINFEWYDMHIIAEWIDRHRGNIDSEQIAVLGCGIFDTIFQSETTTYNTFHNKKNELQTIRNVHVKSANEKCIFVLKIDNLSLKLWSYPVNTVNGFYEPDLITDKNMFDTRDGRQLYFIITSAHHFHQILTVSEVGSIISSFGQKLEAKYPDSKWNIFLVGLANFEEKDSHLFAEFVKVHTNDERSLGELVSTFHFGTDEIIYQYKDTAPFAIEGCRRIRMFFTLSLQWALGNQTSTWHSFRQNLMTDNDI